MFSANEDAASFTLLMTSLGGELMPHLVRNLKRSVRHSKVRIIGTDASEDPVGRSVVDYFIQTPLGSHPEFVDAIADAVTRYGVDLVVPFSDEEALALSVNRERLSVLGASVACNDADIMEVLKSKAKTYTHLASHGVFLPQWVEVNTDDELLDTLDGYLDQFGFAVVKPSISRGGRGVSVISNGQRHPDSDSMSRVCYSGKSEFVRRLMAKPRNNPTVIMEGMLPPSFDIDMLCLDGDVRRLAVRERRHSNLKNAGGNILVQHGEATLLSQDVAEALNLSWLVDCDLMTHSSGKLGLLEVNPRPSGSLAVSVTAGIPMMDDILSIARNWPLPTDNELQIEYGKPFNPLK